MPTENYPQRQERLALCEWHMGQVLMPEHFKWQERALLGHIARRSQLSGLPHYGVGPVSWDETALQRGTLSIQTITLVFPDGTLVCTPGNATVSDLCFGDIESDVPDGHALPIFIHWMRPAEATPNQAHESQNSAHGPRAAMHRLELGTLGFRDDAVASLKLLDVRKNADGEWSLSDHLPPLLQVGNHPFLEPYLLRLQALIRAASDKIETESTDAFLRGEAGHQLRHLHIEMDRLRSLLLDIEGTIFPHPYVLFSAIRDFAFASAACLGRRDSVPVVAYRHDQLATALNGLLEPLEQLLARPAPSPSPRIHFKQRDRLFTAVELPESLTHNPDVFLALQGLDPTEDVSRALKMASPSRLSTVRQHALRGIALQKIDSPRFNHNYGASVSFYRIGSGDEWAQALRERSVGFYVPRGKERVEAALCWIPTSGQRNEAEDTSSTDSSDHQGIAQLQSAA